MSMNNQEIYWLSGVDLYVPSVAPEAEAAGRRREDGRSRFGEARAGGGRLKVAIRRGRGLAEGRGLETSQFCGGRRRANLRFGGQELARPGGAPCRSQIAYMPMSNREIKGCGRRDPLVWRRRAGASALGVSLWRRRAGASVLRRLWSELGTSVLRKVRIGELGSSASKEARVGESSVLGRMWLGEVLGRVPGIGMPGLWGLRRGTGVQAYARAGVWGWYRMERLSGSM